MTEILLPILLSVVLLGIAVVLMGVKALFVKGGKFPSGHAHDIPALRRKGIGCGHGNTHH
ncbi:MAG: hypothetical protein NC339_00600 [Muribaculaceae bacterium]|nr:hypothetical protein [Muribaculaceae bacterium]